jgi:hypothetical protein
MKIVVASIATLLLATAAHAQATRTWVSGVGDDANPCSRTAPCKTFAGAISKTAAGGEISVLDPGGFGVVTITKAITINGDGTLAGILSAGTNGVIVNAGVNDRVVLRNISINGVGTGLNGIRFLAGKNLLLDHVSMSGFTTTGVDMATNVGLATSIPTLQMIDSTITNTPTGIKVANVAAGGLALVNLDRVRIEGLTTAGGAAIDVLAGGRVSVSNSVVSNNLGNGIRANASTAVANVEGCQLAFNSATAVNAAVSGADIRLSNNEIYNNTTGIAIAAGATVRTTSNNRVFGNGSSTAPNGGAVTQQ